jgi:hypothetical protein
MNREEKIEFYKTQIQLCDRLISNGSNPIRWKNHKQNWEYKLKQIDNR